MTFPELDILPELITALSKAGISEPTPIQSAAIPVLLQGKDAYLQAETGTGKTFAYLLPLLTQLKIESASPQIIIVLPTHVLAIQIHRECTALAQNSGMGFRSVLLIGGTPKDRQLEKIKKKPHVVVGSPGRILEWIESGKLKTQQVQSIVIDEADRLLEGESLSDILGIVRLSGRQIRLVFVSATRQPENAEALKDLSPEVAFITAAAAPVNARIEHLFMVCEERKKTDVLRKMIHAFKPERAIVFVHKNDTAEIIADKLSHHKIRAADLHGASHKEDRKRAMDDFRSGKIQVLIASDVAARGLDIKNITHVFNFDPPTESKAYLHRVGRTARGGADGIAVTLIAGPQSRTIRRFREELGIVMTEISLREGEVWEVRG